jgi:hypothetical protein
MIIGKFRGKIVDIKERQGRSGNSLLFVTIDQELGLEDFLVDRAVMHKFDQVEKYKEYVFKLGVKRKDTASHDAFIKDIYNISPEPTTELAVEVDEKHKNLGQKLKGLFEKESK